MEAVVSVEEVVQSYITLRQWSVTVATRNTMVYASIFRSILVFHDNLLALYAAYGRAKITLIPK